MKITLVVLLVFLLLGCSQNRQESEYNDIDSTMSISEGSNSVIYDITTGKDTIIEIFKELEDGAIYINQKRDTMYWLGGDIAGSGNYVSAKEWKEYLNGYIEGTNN